jgi:hypothetical protein
MNSREIICTVASSVKSKFPLLKVKEIWKNKQTNKQKKVKCNLKAVKKSISDGSLAGGKEQFGKKSCLYMYVVEYYSSSVRKNNEM